MRYNGVDIGDLPDELLTGKITVGNLRYIIKLLNLIYRDILNTSLGMVLDHKDGEGYAVDSLYAQRWMNRQKYWYSDTKSGAYQWLKFCISECRDDLNLIIEQNNGKVDNQIYVYKNQLYFILLWMDRPDHEYIELRKGLSD